MFGLKSAAAAESALSLAAAGEFAFVILNQAMGEGVVARPLGEAVLVAASLTMALTPLLTWLGARVGARRGAPPPSEQPATEEGEARVLVIGFGRVGHLVADMLTRH